MPSNCVICGNSAMKDPGVSFHRLPSSPERKRQWLAAFDITEEEWCPHWRVCSRHFPDGNPKTAPRTYEEDQFATEWALRKRAKLNQSRIGIGVSRQMKRNLNQLNSILAMRAHGALSRPFPVLTTSAATNSSVTDDPRTAGSVHSRTPPVLLPVSSLSDSMIGGPVTVFTGDQHKPSATSIHHETQIEPPAGVHIHELVVMPNLDPVDETGSESSGSEESTPGLNSESDVVNLTVLGASQDESGSVNQASTVEHKHMIAVNHTVATQGANSKTDPTSGANQTDAVSGVDSAMSTSCSSGVSSRDISVLVQSALLARIEALDKDNQELRHKLNPSSPPHTSPLCVQVTDSSVGRPTEGVPVEVSVWQNVTADWMSLSSGVTGEDGKWCAPLTHPQLNPGLYRLHVDTQSYFSSQGYQQPYYPYVEVVFCLECSTSHHHISLQLSPFSYTTSSHTL